MNTSRHYYIVFHNSPTVFRSLFLQVFVKQFLPSAGRHVAATLPPTGRVVSSVLTTRYQLCFYNSLSALFLQLVISSVLTTRCQLCPYNSLSALSLQLVISAVLTTRYQLCSYNSLSALFLQLVITSVLATRYYLCSCNSLSALFLQLVISSVLITDVTATFRPAVQLIVSLFYNSRHRYFTNHVTFTVYPILRSTNKGR